MPTVVQHELQQVYVSGRHLVEEVTAEEGEPVRDAQTRGGGLRLCPHMGKVQDDTGQSGMPPHERLDEVASGAPTSTATRASATSITSASAWARPPVIAVMAFVKTSASPGATASQSKIGAPRRPPPGRNSAAVPNTWVTQ